MLVTIWQQLLFEAEYPPALFIALGLASKSSQTARARRSLILGPSVWRVFDKSLVLLI